MIAQQYLEEYRLLHERHRRHGQEILSRQEAGELEMSVAEIKEYLDDSGRWIKLLKGIREGISGIRNYPYQRVLEYRYILSKPWQRIADDFGLSLEQIHLLHEEALLEFRVPNDPVD